MLAVSLAALALALPATTGAYLYWHGNDTIVRANLDGTNVNTSFIPNAPGSLDGVAVTGRYIYFGREAGLIGRASLNGSDIQANLISIPQPPPEDRSGEYADSLAVGAAHIYWSETYSDGIGRANLDGGVGEPGFIKTEAHVLDVAVDAGHLYWASEHAIGRANLNGSDIEQNFIQPPTPIKGLAVADGHIYWGVNDGHDIDRANLDGREVDQHFITALGYVSNFAVGGGYIYWEDNEGFQMLGRAWIGRANLNGSNVRSELVEVEGVNVNGRPVTSLEGAYENGNNVISQFSVNGGLGRLAADALGPGASPAKPSHPKHKRRH